MWSNEQCDAWVCHWKWKTKPLKMSHSNGEKARMNRDILVIFGIYCFTRTPIIGSNFFASSSSRFLSKFPLNSQAMLGMIQKGLYQAVIIPWMICCLNLGVSGTSQQLSQQETQMPMFGYGSRQETGRRLVKQNFVYTVLQTSIWTTVVISIYSIWT